MRKADREKKNVNDVSLHDDGFDAELDRALQEGGETGQTSDTGKSSMKSSGWDMWNDYKEGQNTNDLNDDDHGENENDNDGNGSKEEKSSFPLPPHLRGAQGAYHAKMVAEKEEDPRFAGRKKGGYKAPGSQDKSRPPVTNPRLNAKAAGGSFSAGSGPLARQNTMAGSPDTSNNHGNNEDLQSSPLRMSPDKKSMTLDLSKGKCMLSSLSLSLW